MPSSKQRKAFWWPSLRTIIQSAEQSEKWNQDFFRSLGSAGFRVLISLSWKGKTDKRKKKKNNFQTKNKQVNHWVERSSTRKVSKRTHVSWSMVGQHWCFWWQTCCPHVDRRSKICSRSEMSTPHHRSDMAFTGVSIASHISHCGQGKTMVCVIQCYQLTWAICDPMFRNVTIIVVITYWTAFIWFNPHNMWGLY